MWNVKTKRDTSNNKGNWNHLKVTQTVTQQHTAQARIQGNAENSHSEHCTSAVASADAQ